MFTAKQYRFTAKQYRAKAAEAADALKHADLPNEIQELRRLKSNFTALADNDEWLAENFKKVIHSHDSPQRDDLAEIPADGVSSE